MVFYDHIIHFIHSCRLYMYAKIASTEYLFTIIVESGNYHCRLPVHSPALQSPDFIQKLCQFSIIFIYDI